MFRLQGEKQPLLQDALVFVAGGQRERSVDGLTATIMRSGGSDYTLNDKRHRGVGTNQPKYIQDSLLSSIFISLPLIPPVGPFI